MEGGEGGGGRSHAHFSERLRECRRYIARWRRALESSSRCPPRPSSHPAAGESPQETRAPSRPAPPSDGTASAAHKCVSKSSHPPQPIMCSPLSPTLYPLLLSRLFILPPILALPSQTHPPPLQISTLPNAYSTPPHLSNSSSASPHPSSLALLTSSRFASIIPTRPPVHSSLHLPPPLSPPLPSSHLNPLACPAHPIGPPDPSSPPSSFLLPQVCEWCDSPYASLRRLLSRSAVC